VSASLKSSPAPDGFIAGKNASYDGLPRLGRWYVKGILLPLERFAFFLWHWRNAMELQGYYLSEEMACREANRHERGFYMPLPLDSSHPAQLGRYGPQMHPRSPVAEKYKLKIIGAAREEARKTQTSRAHIELNVCLQNIPYVEARYADLDARVSKLERGKSDKEPDPDC
jgi:hypothetical protein